MAIERTDSELNIIGNNVRGINFLDDQGVRRASIWLDAQNRLNVGNAVININGAPGGGDTGGATITIHSQLQGLGADDHAQYVHRTTARTITARHTFNPSVAASPFILGPNAQNETVVGLRADSLNKSVTGVDGLTGGGALVADVEIGMSTPGPVSAQSTNTATANHTHAVIASANPGANERLLKSTTSGGLTLQTLAVQGNVDIVNGGDLTVGANVLFVDAGSGRVGINRNPDPQFQLDIEGNIRWSGWGVGKMALQLDGALMICHYDGGQPFSRDYGVITTGHMGQPATWTGGIIGRPGKFETKAVQIAPSATNFVPNPSFETNDTGWLTRATNTLARTLADSRYGDFSMQITVGTPSDGLLIYNGNDAVLDNGGDHVFSAWIWVPNNWDGGDIRISSPNFAGSSVTHIEEWLAASSPRREWFRISAIVNIDAGDITGAIGISTTSLPTTGRLIRVDGFQVEEGTFATPYLDGSLDITHPNGATGQHAWTGTAHASKSTRNASYLTYNTGNTLQVARGTIMAWVYLDDTTGGNQFVFWHFNSGHRIFLYSSSAGDWRAGLGDNGSLLVSGVSVVAREWVHLALTWDSDAGNESKLYVNGTLTDTETYSTLNTLTTICRVGVQGTGDHLNGYVDDFIIADRAISADEIRAVYESDAPVFAETSTFHWQPPGPAAIWVDEDGFFGRDEDGNPIIGLSVKDSKSWGGFTLNQGDFLLGNSSDGYLHWDIDGGLGAAGKLTINAIVDRLQVADTVLDGDGVFVGGYTNVATGDTPWDLVSGFTGAIAFGDSISGDTFGAIYGKEISPPVDIYPLVIHARATHDLGGGNFAGAQLDLRATGEQTGDSVSIALTVSAGPSPSKTINLNPGTGGHVNIVNGVLTVSSFTTTQRNALSVSNGAIIYNTTTGQFEGRAGGSWVAL